MRQRATMMLSLTAVARRSVRIEKQNVFLDMSRRRIGDISVPKRRVVTKEERASLRAARKDLAQEVLSQRAQGGGADAAASAASGSKVMSAKNSRYYWYMGLTIPTVLLVWGLNDENSPPAKFCQMIGLTKLIERYTDDIAKPVHEKLLPDWSQMPNVPQGIPIPHTLVLDLEKTLVSSTWDRKHGWRHAKRPGVDRFLMDMAQYYEIVLYSPSHEGIADPVITSLDPKGCIMHRLYREATYYMKGIHVKDLNRLNRDVKRMIVLDDDPLEVQLNPENLIRVKPYTDPNNRSDNTLERITPFLIEIAREGYKDIPALLEQYRGMDADEIADEQDFRTSRFIQDRQQRSQRGLGGFAASPKAGGLSNLPPPEMTPLGDQVYLSGGQLTSAQIAGMSDTSTDVGGGGFADWLNRRSGEKAEQQKLKMEKWQEVMQKKSRERAAAAAAAEQSSR